MDAVAIELPDFDKVEVNCDDFGVDIGGGLIQSVHLVAFSVKNFLVRKNITLYII